jgi:tetratricopeptide (TPR) repeat protein
MKLTSENPSQQQLDKLLELYKHGRYEVAEKLAVSITQEFPKNQFVWKVLGVILGQTGRNEEAINANKIAITLSPLDAEVHVNLGVLLRNIGRLQDSETYYKKAILLNPNYIEAHCNLGVTLKMQGRLSEAEVSYKKAISLKPDYAEAYNNLGNTQKEQGRLQESKESYLKAISLKIDFFQAHFNLASILEELENFEGAEASYKQAISLNPNYKEAHYFLGKLLRANGKFEESEVSLRQAISINPLYAEAYYNLGITLEKLNKLKESESLHRKCISLEPNFSEAHKSLSKLLFSIGQEDAALKSIVKAVEICPTSQDGQLLYSVMKSRNIKNKDEKSKDKNASEKKLALNPIVLNREVEEDLIRNLYTLQSRGLDDTIDARYGNGTCSLNFELFENKHPNIQTLAKDLTKIMKETVESNIFILDSFFNILRSGGGSTPHRHITELDKDKSLNLWKQKYSLVYYLTVGDQDCSEPGILKLYNPNEDILPRNGMITIIPASRVHSAIYNGKEDRVMIGVNFYCL